MANKYKLNIKELCITFLGRNRFYANILAKLVKIPTDHVLTAGVGFNQLGKLSLYFNPNFLLQLRMESGQAILEHEILHAFFRHLYRFKFTKNPYLDQLTNIGCDMAINQYIKDLPTKEECAALFTADALEKAKKNLPALVESVHRMNPHIPKEEIEKALCDPKEVKEWFDKTTTGPCLPEDEGFEKEMAADYYIEMLKKKRPPCPKCGKPMKGQQGKGQQQQQGQGQGQGQSQQQGKGKGQGKGQQQQQGQGSGQGQQGQQQGQGGQGQQQGKCPHCGQDHGMGSMDDHSLWEKVIDQSTGKITSVKDLGFDPEYETVSVIQKAIKECKDFGSLPSFVRREIEALQKPINRHNWKHELRIFVNSVLAMAKRMSQKRQNKRGMGLPYVLSGKKKDRKPSILLARDTSGSVFDDATQNEFLNEMINISKFCAVIVADCDTVVHQEYRVKNVKDFKEYKGGGGTAFEPIFELALKMNVDGIIYLTDTYGSFPDEKDIGKLAKKTIWVTIGQEKVSVPFGRHVNIPKKGVDD